MSKDWKTYKKKLPKDWASQVAERLKMNGLELTSKQVSQVRIGNIANLHWQQKVWKEIIGLAKETEKTKKQVQKLKVA